MMNWLLNPNFWLITSIFSYTWFVYLIGDWRSETDSKTKLIFYVIFAVINFYGVKMNIFLRFIHD